MDTQRYYTISILSSSSTIDMLEETGLTFAAWRNLSSAEREDFRLKAYNTYVDLDS